ncbi:MAG TPA: hypothetical protein VJC39_02965 [Candidatus Nanoarchaeia archaeon]|nr:hypothetical protein [Candidatus Nanoarchaeia archaeon]
MSKYTTRLKGCILLLGLIVGSTSLVYDCSRKGCAGTKIPSILENKAGYESDINKYVPNIIANNFPKHNLEKIINYNF